MRTWAALVAWLVAGFSAAATASAADLLRIEGLTWGYDGTVMINAYNPVSFELHNDSNDPMNLLLRLTKSNGIEPVDAPIGVAGPDEPVYLAPQSSRRVQLFAYVQNMHNEFALSWGRDPSQRLDLTANAPIKIGPPATVIFYDSEAVLPRGSGLPRFDESFFPVSASGATGLGSVVMDHAPRWQTTQQQAFLDWLRSGGVVHLLQATGGELATFEGDLAVVNSPLDDQRVGAGRIIRHQTAMADLDRAFVELQVLPRNTRQLKPAPPEVEGQDPNQAMNYGWVDWDVAGQVYNRLKQMTRPNHNWPLIYLMSLVYLLLIFPGCWLIGRRKADYRLTYGVMLGAVVLFSMGFKTVGQRGYGEQTAMHAVTIAQPLEGGRLLFRQWANLFVTDGDDYRIRHAGNGLLYSSGQSNEAVRGWIVSPPAGEFIADVPPFSSRTIAAAGVADVGGFTTTVDQLTLGERLEALKIRIDPPLPKQGVTGLALYRDQTYTLGPADNGGYQLVAADRPFDLALKTDTWQQYAYNYGFGYDSGVNENELFDSAMCPLIAVDAGIYDEQSQKRFQLAGDRVRIYLFAEMPESLYANLEYAATADRPLPAKRVGRVLYVFDVFPPE